MRRDRFDTGHLKTKVAIVAVAFLTLIWVLQTRDDHHTQSTTRVDDLEIQGTTDGTGLVTLHGGMNVVTGDVSVQEDVGVGGFVAATGEVKTIAGVRLADTGGGPTVTAGNGDPNGSITAPVGSVRLRSDTAQLYQNSDGATSWSQVGGGGGASDVSIVASATAIPTGINLSTLGTVDWMACTLSNTPPHTDSPSVRAQKASDGRLYDGLYYVASNGTSISYTAAAGGPTRSTTATDSVGAALSSSATTCRMSFGGGTNWGYVFRIPTSVESNVLTILASAYMAPQ